ncbi:MAG: TIGR04211 family SH3 domain-containing protein [Gammaproteobacteria bacterium]|nr:MAG: TIGR04211 family SH3 domain-containing protein [Gammaproteobacteria bacterium]
MVKNKVFYNRNFSIHSFVLPVFVMLAVIISMPVHAKTSYVSDELKVPMRSGASNGHRIIKFLKSGTALTVLGASDDNKFIEVEIAGGKTGWVEIENVMDIPSGRDRLVYANEKLAKVKQENKGLKKSIAGLKSEIRKLKNEKGTLQNERINLSNSLDDLKITAANPLALSKKNKQLKKKLNAAEDRAAMLDKDNQQLRSNLAQEWFMIGGAVSIGSLILGLILTRINWRRKRNSWGDSF